MTDDIALKAIMAAAERIEFALASELFEAEDAFEATVQDALAYAGVMRLQREHDDIRAKMGDSLFMREYLRQRREDINADVATLRAKLEVR